MNLYEQMNTYAPQHPRDHGSKRDLGNQLQLREVSLIIVHTDGQSRNTLAAERPLGKNARNITNIPLVWTFECTNRKLS